MGDKVMQVVRLLLAGTREGRVRWSYIPEDDTIRTTVDAAVVRVVRDVFRVEAEAGGPEATDYFVYVLEPSGRVRAQAAALHGEPDYDTVDELFRLARPGPLDSDPLLDRLIETLKG